MIIIATVSRGSLSMAFFQKGCCGTVVNPAASTASNTTSRPRAKPNNEPMNRSAKPSPAVLTKADISIVSRPMANRADKNIEANASTPRNWSPTIADGSMGANAAANELATMNAITQPANDSSSRTTPRTTLSKIDNTSMARTA